MSYRQAYHYGASSVNKIPFDSRLNKVIHLWCQWCVDHNRMVTLQAWSRYTHDGEILTALVEFYKSVETKKRR